MHIMQKFFDEQSDAVDYKFWFKVENLRLMSGTYDVNVSSNKISNFKNQNVTLNILLLLNQSQHTMPK